MRDRYDVLIVGTGHAGAQCAIALRQRGFAGSIGLLGEERDPPYERPPLSKEYLAGAKPFERILIRPLAFWAERGIELLLGQRVEAVDAAVQTVRTADGATIGYGELVWAAGGHARRLICDGHDLAGVHSIRSRADVDTLATELPAAAEVVVIGGGYIGLEAAAVLRKLGKRVELVEAQERVLARVAGEPLSRFYESEHRRHGVTIRLCETVVCIEANAGRVSGVRLADGEVIPAEIVIVGVGLVPAVAPLLAAGASGGDGVEVDEACRTTLPHVWAIGDCARHSNDFAKGALIRLESVQNANDMANTAAAAITGAAARYHAVPWFWSNQYDLRLQTVGLSRGADATVVRGDPTTRSFSVAYLREGRVVALDCVNATKDYVAGRSLVAKGTAPPLAALADPAVPLKSLAA